MIPILAGICPACETPLAQYTAEQPALFAHAGYGATELTRVQRCDACGWSVRSEVSEVRPRV